jgi:hypothetical protein
VESRLRHRRDLTETGQGLTEIEQGEFYYMRDPATLKVLRIGVWPAGCEAPVLLDVVPHEGRPCWTLSGTEDEPTLMPSVFVNPPRGWHGFITDGIARTV